MAADVISELEVRDDVAIETYRTIAAESIEQYGGRHLVRNGVVVLKFHLRISKAEQKRRLLARLDEPAKRWKFSMHDVEERKRWVATVRHGRPEIRITMTYPAIGSSRHVVFLAAGEAKAAILRQIRVGGSELPAARVRPVGELLWFVDRAAAAEG